MVESFFRQTLNVKQKSVSSERRTVLHKSPIRKMYEDFTQKEMGVGPAVSPIFKDAVLQVAQNTLSSFGGTEGA